MRIKEIAQEIHQINIDKGFWEGGKEAKNFGEVIALIHSELSEALEAHRKNNFTNPLWYSFNPDSGDTTAFERQIKNTVEDELADVAIRLFDVCEGYGIDLEKHIRLKVDYNKTRPFKHGKTY